MEALSFPHLARDSVNALAARVANFAPLRDIAHPLFSVQCGDRAARADLRPPRPRLSAGPRRPVQCVCAQKLPRSETRIDRPGSTNKSLRKFRWLRARSSKRLRPLNRSSSERLPSEISRSATNPSTIV